MKGADNMSFELVNLLDTKTYRFIDKEHNKITLEHFDDCAILSHRWQLAGETAMRPYKDFAESMKKKLTSALVDSIMDMDDKATVEALKDVMNAAGLDKQPENYQLTSIAKILRFCRRADLEHKYAWVDSCCIDKTNNSVTSKAIGSMWDYYSLSRHCYVYMSDVSGDRDKLAQEFNGSEWFKRGWTLQELLASYNTTEFYDQRWRRIQSQPGFDLKDSIERSTKIAPKLLQNPKQACVAVRMSWLSGRETGLDEDMAYCMIGLFGVQLQVNYGEGGENAFRRLQMAIIEHQRYAQDESIFAWSGIPEVREMGSKKPARVSACGLLAPWPSHFANSGNVTLMPDNECKSRLEPKISAARDGVVFQMPVKHMHINNGADMNIADAARSNQKEIFLNVREAHVAVGAQQKPSGSRGLFGRLGKGKEREQEGQPGNQLTMDLVKNTEKQWRRQPIDTHRSGKGLKQGRNVMPLFIPHRAASDTDAKLSQAKKGGPMDGMNAAIDAQKRH